jgi:Protein of unknown function (DUF1778).
MEKAKKDKKEDYIHIRIDSQTKALIEKAAQEDGRSLSNYLIRTVLEKLKGH